MTRVLAGYRHLLLAAARLQWDAETISLIDDAAALSRLAAADRAMLTELTAGFHVAEHAVADELTPWITASADPLARECFTVQAGDEARHARFFDRVWEELLDGRAPAAASAARPGLVELFHRELPAVARALTDDASTLGEAVALYHLVLEGIVFAVGQDALLELAVRGGLTGVADGVRRVQTDERWHVGLGVLALQRLGAPVDVTERAARAIAAWGPAVATPERTARVLAAHRRRLTIAGDRAAAASAR